MLSYQVGFSSNLAYFNAGAVWVPGQCACIHVHSSTHASITVTIAGIEGPTSQVSPQASQVFMAPRVRASSQVFVAPHTQVPTAPHSSAHVTMSVVDAHIPLLCKQRAFMCTHTNVHAFIPPIKPSLLSPLPPLRATNPKSLGNSACRMLYKFV